MSIFRAAAEIEPKAAICSRSSIFPGPMRPSGSRFILRLSEGICVVPCMSRLRSLTILPDLLLACRLPCRPRAGGGPHGVCAVEGDRLDHGKDRQARGKAQHFGRLPSDAGRDDLAIAVDRHVGEMAVVRADCDNPA